MPLAPQQLPGALTRSVGRVLRAQMTARGASLGDLSAVAGVSQSQLSRMLHGQRRMDLEQLNVLCDALGLDIVSALQLARGETPTERGATATASNSDVAELGRRVRVLAKYSEDAYETARLAARRVKVELSRDQWDDLLDGALSRVPDTPLLVAISVALDGGPDYLTTVDEETVSQAEARLDFASAVRESGTSQIAARALSNLSSDELRAVAEILRHA